MIINFNCAICGGMMTKEVEDGIPDFVTRKLMALTAHDRCTEQKNKEADESAAKKLLEDRKDRWKEICLPRYQDFDPTKCGDLKTSEQIMGWDFSSGQGLVIIGDSRAGKTRAAFKLLEKKFMEGQRVFVARGTQWTTYAIDSAKGDLNARRMIERAHSADITFIDDFAKNAWTERVEAEFWDLLEDRGGRLKPVVLTCRETGEALITRMGQNANDIIKRIREYCDVIKFSGGEND